MYIEYTVVLPTVVTDATRQSELNKDRYVGAELTRNAELVDVFSGSHLGARDEL